MFYFLETVISYVIISEKQESVKKDVASIDKKQKSSVSKAKKKSNNNFTNN